MMVPEYLTESDDCPSFKTGTGDPVMELGTAAYASAYVLGTAVGLGTCVVIENQERIEDSLTCARARTPRRLAGEGRLGKRASEPCETLSASTIILRNLHNVSMCKISRRGT